MSLEIDDISTWIGVILLIQVHVYIQVRKESLNSDGQQFHQYQQNEQSPVTSNHLTLKRPRYTSIHS